MRVPEPQPAARARTPADLHVLVAGAGGLGCPAAWALAASGVGRLTLLDPDHVEISNLPRQVLFEDADLGRPKAPAAAARLPSAVFAGGVHARLDDRNAADLLAGVDVLIDATDGARAKDWINQLAVRRDVPLVHAAGLRSEGRLLVVPAGGRPCLACLFGRLDEETGTCRDLGVWNGVVGTVGALAAQAALELAVRREAVPSGYQVLDFETGRALSLPVRARSDCPVCAAPGRLEPYPAEAPCALRPESDGATPVTLDLSAERCPLNLLRARRALEDLPQGALLDVLLGAEGARTVPDGVRALGHDVLREELRGAGLFLRVRATGTRAGPRLDSDDLRRYARQVVLPEVGEPGQLALAAARVRVLGAGLARESACVYLRAAGVGRVLGTGPGPADLTAWAGGAPPPAGSTADVGLAPCGDGACARLEPDTLLGDHALAPAVQLALGALLADVVQRRLLLPRAPRASFSIDASGRARGGRAAQ